MDNAASCSDDARTHKRRRHIALNIDLNKLPIEDVDFLQSAPQGSEAVAGSTLPAWALALQPVRKLPTNVGSRIRNCIYDSLSKSPPVWAREILEHSISKEVYRPNASGPTKKAVASVLSMATDASLQKIPTQDEEERESRDLT